MAAISKTLPYTELSPLPVPTERCSTLKKVIACVASILAVTTFFAGVGTLLGLMEIGFSIITGAILGTLIGVVMGLFLFRFIETTSPVGDYRLETLRQIESTQSSPDALTALEKLKIIFRKPLTFFRQTYENHSLHDNLTTVTKHIDPKRKDIKKVWEVFLKHINKLVVRIPDGKKVTLNFDTELDLLQGKKVETTIEELTQDTPSLENDLQQLVELQEVGFGKPGTFTVENFKDYLKNGSKFLITRKKGTTEILGFVWGGMDKKEEFESFCIRGLLRKPEAASLGIGSTLLYSFINQLDPKTRVHLQVRQSNNTAIELYQKYGFVRTRTFPSYYTFPDESADLMQLNWDHFEKIRKQLQPSVA